MQFDEEQTRAERLAEDVAHRIIAGDLVPGARLDEHSVAESYGVSRTPVREALRQLASTGLVEIRPRRGAIVATLTSVQLETMFAAMAELEATCARLSAISMTPIERRRLQSLHESMHGLVASGRRKAYAEANQMFHTQIYGGSHNAVLAEMTAQMRRRLSAFRRAQFRSPGRLPRSHGEHGAVVDAILAANAGEAHAAMLHHVSLVEDAYEQLTTGPAVRSGNSRMKPAGTQRGS